MRLKTRLVRWKMRNQGVVREGGLNVPLDMPLVTGPVLDALWTGVYGRRPYIFICNAFERVEAN